MKNPFALIGCLISIVILFNVIFTKMIQWAIAGLFDKHINFWLAFVIFTLLSYFLIPKRR